MKLSNLGQRHLRRRTQSVLVSARAISLVGTRHLMVAGLLAWSAMAGAQTSSLPMPGSSSANHLPKAWPAEEETAMLQKLIDLAEGPPPSIEELSKAMGVTIEKGWNFTEAVQGHDIRGPAPFGGKTGRYVLVPASANGWSLSINLLFDSVTKLDSLGGRPFCLTGDLIAEQLKKLGWTYYQRVVQPHSMLISGWKKESSTDNRYMGWSTGPSHCAGSVSLGYAIHRHHPQKAP